MRIRNSLLILLFLSMLSCDFKTDEKKTAKLKAGSTIETDKNMVDQKDIFKEKVVVFLSKEPDLESNVLDIQDFIENGKAFIPVFSSLEKVKESTQGADLPFPKYQIDGLFLLSIMNGNETLRVNPTLSDEAFFRASELKEYYKADIEKLLKKILSEDE